MKTVIKIPKTNQPNKPSLWVFKKRGTGYPVPNEVREFNGQANNAMMEKISKRCGYENCPFYDKTNKESKCSKYSDRTECSLSMRKRKRVAKTSRLKNSRNLRF